MSNNERSPSFIDALRNPRGVFKRPGDVMSVSDWSLSKKRAVIELWRRDEELGSVAEEEGVTGGAPSMLDQVLAVQGELDRELAARGETEVPSTESHKVAGICETREQAEATFDALLAAGFSADELHILGPNDSDRLDDTELDLKAESAPKAAAGAILGATAVTTVAAILGVPAVPAVLAATAGGLLGSSAGAAAAIALSETDFRDLAKEALESDCWAVIVEAGNGARALEAQDAIARSPAKQSIDQSGAVRDETGGAD